MSSVSCMNKTLKPVILCESETTRVMITFSFSAWIISLSICVLVLGYRDLLTSFIPKHAVLPCQHNRL